MAHNYTGLVKAVNTTNRRREATSLSDDELIDMMAEVAASMPASSEEIMATRPAEPTRFSIGELRNPANLSGDDLNVRYQRTRRTSGHTRPQQPRSAVTHPEPRAGACSITGTALAGALHIFYNNFIATA